MSTIKQRTTMPRRTEEFEFSAQSSLKKPPLQRLSRIAQPLRKLSKASFGHGLNENRRSASCDRPAVLPNAVGVQTPGSARKLGYNKRSLSATPANKTPLRGNENSAKSSTVEKDKPPLENREWIMTQCERILDYLETVHDLPKEFVERRNLKAMSLKQFLVIMNHIFKQIGGSRYKLGTNFIEDIMKTMAELEYPYTINKSMLKTPNVPHSINHVIVLIGWLVQLAPHVSHEITPLKRSKELQEDFPNCEYQDFFFERVQDGFSLWNLKKMSEYDAIVEQLTDGLVAARTNGSSQQEIGQKILEMEQEIQDLNNRTIQNGRELSMDGLAEKIQDQREVKKKLHEEVKNIQKQTNKLEEEYYSKQEEYYSRVKKIEELKQDIETQQLAASERDEIINLISANKSLLTAKRLAVSLLEQSSYDQQIVVSRLLKQKFNLISNLNTTLYQMANNLKPMINFEAPTLNLKTENYAELLENLQTIKTQMEGVISKQSFLYSQLNEEKSHVEHQLSNLQIQFTAVDKSLEETTARYEQLQTQRQALIDQLSDISVENSQASHRKKDEQIHKEREIAQLRQQCEQNRIAVEKLTMEKHKQMAQKLEECQQVLAAKKSLQKELTVKLEEMESVIESVERELGPLD